jgi:hypothetical protein
MRLPITYLIVAVLLVVSDFGGIAQCPFDYNNDGIVNFDQDLLLHLGQYGTSGPDLMTDHNGNGLADIRDLYEFSRHLGTWECEDLTETFDHIGELVLHEYYVHDTAYYDAFDTIPAGSITYRLYLELANIDDRIVGIFGDNTSPLVISTPGEFYHTQIGGSPIGGFSTNGINWAIATLVPTIWFTSFFTLNDPPEGVNYSNSIFSTIQHYDSSFIDEFLAGQDVIIDSEYGGGVYGPDVWGQQDTSYSDLKLIGQFTTVGSTEISGQLNFEVRPLANIDGDLFETSEMLSFSLANLAVFGCMNVNSDNYDPNAQYDDGSCYSFGDLNGDGVTTVSDLLNLVAELGCTDDCGLADLNGDGIVNIWDLLILLGIL